jgi:hypothetical protein
MSLRKFWLLVALMVLTVSTALWAAANHAIPIAVRPWVEGPVYPGYVIAVMITHREHGVSPILGVAANAIFWATLATAAVARHRYRRRGQPA